MTNIVRLWPIYTAISTVAILLSIFAIFAWGFKPSIDFTGGSVVLYQVEQEAAKDKILEFVKEYFPKEVIVEGKEVTLTFGPGFGNEKAGEVKNKLNEGLGEKVELLKFETIGSTLSVELLKKTFTGTAIGALGILVLVAWQFKNFKFGICAILALFHDLTILLGTFAVLGWWKGAEVDILVVTAFLMTLSLSVYDTIVVYDRIRESQKTLREFPFSQVVNKAVLETATRSLNTSLTAIFTLTSLFIFGGETIRWFVFALLIGVITGTYSSPFVASPLLVLWDTLRRKFSKVTP